ncbi:response regulator transcription factor [Gordonia asplenii]|uniref:response regulator transcription factor n=1 Tax=Gordonia asplenii TaxID=2725283 RepID=UPI0028A92E7D|nr:response regulator transcription factor [Gordonia asplenii]
MSAQSSPPTAIRAYLVDDHELVRRGLRDLLSTADDIDIVGEAASVAEARVGIAATLPDVAVLDVRLPDGSGVELCRDVRSDHPRVHCLMLTSYSDDDALMAAVVAGASGFVLKQILGHNLIAAVRTVGHGGSLLDRRSTEALMKRIRSSATHDDPLSQLTDRERDIVSLIGDGLTNRQIAERTHLAEKTVKNYVTRVLAKLDMERRTQVAVLATELRNERRDSSS